MRRVYTIRIAEHLNTEFLLQIGRKHKMPCEREQAQQGDADGDAYPNLMAEANGRNRIVIVPVPAALIGTGVFAAFRARRGGFAALFCFHGRLIHVPQAEHSLSVAYTIQPQFSQRSS